MRVLKKCYYKKDIFSSVTGNIILYVYKTHTHTQCVLSTLVTFNVLRYNYVDNYAKIGNNSRAII